MSLRSFVHAVGILSTLVIIGCGDGEDETPPDAGGPETPEGLEISGTWESSFGATEIIADESWDSIGADFTSSSEIVRFDNEQNSLVSKGPDFMDPEKDVFSRVVWTEPEGGSFYYCTVLYGRETLSEALIDAGVADPSDPEAGGCGDGDFPWTRLSEQ